MPHRPEILIDAYNVMFAHSSLGPSLRRDPEHAREEFLRLIVQMHPADATRMIVVFDATRGTSPETELGRIGTTYQKGLHVVFARDSADDWIQDRVRTHGDPKTLTVVTADREILETARAHGARIQRVSEFLQLPRRRQARARALRRRDKPEHVSRREVAEWEALFEKKRRQEPES